MKDDIMVLVFILSGIIIAGLIAATGIFLKDVHSRHMCDSYSEMTITETKYVRFDACYVRYYERYLHIDDYRVMERSTFNK